MKLLLDKLLAFPSILPTTGILKSPITGTLPPLPVQVLLASTGVVLFTSGLFLSSIYPLSLDESQHIVIVTGCDSGFGLLTSQQLSKRGFLVLSTCLTLQGVDKLQGTGVAKAIRCDVTKEQDVVSLIAACTAMEKSTGAKLWCVVNNAGIAPIGAIDWMEMESFQRVMDVNYFGSVRVMKHTLALLKRTRNSRIINVSSLAGLLAGQLMGAYCASKHALEAVTKSLRDEMRPWGVQVGAVNPGFTRTPLINNSIDLCRNEFEKAPLEIREQYDYAGYDAFGEAVQRMQQDPQWVVNAIIRNVYARHVPRNTIVLGTAMNILLGVFLCFPIAVQDFLNRTFTPIFGSRPAVIRRIQSARS